MSKPRTPSRIYPVFVSRNGFTLVELISVMILVGILAVAVLPRLLNVNSFDSRAYTDKTAAMIRYGQKIAIAQQRPVFVNIDTGANSACLNFAAINFGGGGTCAAGGQPVISPSENIPYISAAPGGITLTTSANSFSFTAIGAPSPNALVTLEVSGDVARNIIIEQETGYVHVQ